MTILPPHGIVIHRGMTLMELTVCISVLLIIIMIVFIGANAWKRGSDRAGCVLTLRNVQMAARSYQNIYGYTYGGRPYAENGTQDIASHLYAKGYIEKKLHDQATGIETCPSLGNYTRNAPDVFPQAGELYMKCSLSASDEHEPDSHADW
jgi:prepilin-type N-terminal cleavage/methylation domain-containing protein